MPHYIIANKDCARLETDNRETAAQLLQDGGVIYRKWRKHTYIQLDRSFNGGGFTSVRVGYGGLIEEPLSDAKARFLRNDPHFAPD